ncbi:hypothetical protein MKX03_037889 [Papaver bracteatum]|nr:hypothetical protein MKX03_037889 [Papaver bracteatum]
MSFKKVGQFSVLVLLIVASTVTMGTAESQPLSPTQLLPNIPEIVKCWSTLVDIEASNRTSLLQSYHWPQRNLLAGRFLIRSGMGNRNTFQPYLPKCGQRLLCVHNWRENVSTSSYVSTATTTEPPTTSLASSVTMGTAESQPLAPTQLDTIRIPGLFPPLLPGPYNPEIEKCWSTLVDIEGCKVEILNFLFTFQLRLGPACCKAIIDLSETCLPAVFSSVSGWGIGIPYPNVIKGYCASITGGKQSPPSPFALHMSPPPQAHRGAPKHAPTTIV